MQCVFQYVFELACFVFAVAAFKHLIGSFPEAFRMLCIYDLPVEENDARHEEKAPAVEVFDEEHRREHTEEAPVIDTTVHTAHIPHDERLK